ncbi:response regulator [Niabella sp. W65]|nr:response regulator [Niabella sp. W65]MCH7366455.1 response regulator [Niabella sp. W65]
MDHEANSYSRRRYQHQEVFDIIFGRNYQITSLENGDAIIAGLNYIPDLFVIDHRLPGYSGVELCAYIKGHALLNQVPVLMISATIDIAEAAMAAGADEFINKPFNIDHIRDRVDFYTGRAMSAAM